jgi:cobalt-zinc-cadmium efflux system membrane fusion protein
MIGIQCVTGCARGRAGGAAASETETAEPSARVVSLSPEAIGAADIETDVARGRRVAVEVETPGEIRMDAERVVQVRPRFAGTVHELRKSLGDPVAKGEVVALVNSNESLSSYEIVSPLAGTVVARGASAGEAVEHEDVLYTIADLTRVWADFVIYPQYVSTIRRGMTVTLRADRGPEALATGTVSYVGPLLERDTRTTYGRVVLSNAGGTWPPGLTITAAVRIRDAQVTVAVPEDAIVRMADGPAVFVPEHGSFRAQGVQVGLTDGTFTEITGGLGAGDSFVVKNAFLLKAELGKAEAGDED